MIYLVKAEISEIQDNVAMRKILYRLVDAVDEEAAEEKFITRFNDYEAVYIQEISKIIT